MLLSSGFLQTRQHEAFAPLSREETNAIECEVCIATTPAHLSMLPNSAARCRLVARLTAFWPSRSAIKASAPLYSKDEMGGARRAVACREGMARVTRGICTCSSSIDISSSRLRTAKCCKPQGVRNVRPVATASHHEAPEELCRWSTAN